MNKARSESTFWPGCSLVGDTRLELMTSSVWMTSAAWCCVMSSAGTCWAVAVPALAYAAPWRPVTVS